MNQIVGTKKDGSSFLALILEPGNFFRLKNGDPISVRVEDSFPSGIPKRLEIMIAHSKTPHADALELAKTADVVLDERNIVGPKTPHCPECRSSIEQFGAMQNESPLALVYCAVCGCVMGTTPSETLKPKPKADTSSIRLAEVIFDVIDSMSPTDKQLWEDSRAQFQSIYAWAQEFEQAHPLPWGEGNYPNEGTDDYILAVEEFTERKLKEMNLAS